MQKLRSKITKTQFSLILILLLLVSTITVFNTNIQAQENTQQVPTDRNIFADIAAENNDGVVKVTTEVEIQSSDNQFYNDPFYRYFFGDQLPESDEPRTREGYGSGFIVSEDGYIVTNQHVVNKADNVKVTINGFDDPVPAEIVWSDFNLDLAVLKVDVDKDLTALDLGNSDNLRPGDWAVAIGNPFGFEHTVTAGVISALGRPIKVPTNTGQIREYSNLIQLDAAINPGNSGGPLLNIDGKVIGINTAVSSQGQGIGFAIPVNEIKGIIDELKRTGEVTRPWLGISFRGINEDIKEYFKLDNTKGVLVMGTVEDSPAAKAGLQKYDIIKEIDQQTIEGTDDLIEIINNKEIGEKVMIRVIRNGESEVVFTEIGKRPDRM
ncbi:MAG: S1C family serine protease [Bacillota bacterium]